MLLYGIAVELGVSRPAAFLAAVVAAAHPLLIVFSGVLNRQAIYLFAAFGSILALIGFVKHGGRARLVAFVLGAVLATASRPEGAHVLIPYVAVLLLVPGGRRTRVSAGVALALLIPVILAYLRYAVESKPPSGGSLAVQMPLFWTVLFDHGFTPSAWIVAWTLGLALGFRRRAAWVALLTLFGLDLAWRWTGLYHMFVGYDRQVASARYESILLVPFMIGVALLIQAVLHARTWLKVAGLAAFLVLTAATFRQPYETLLTPFTIDEEYRFLRKYALTLPPRARLYVLDAPLDDIGLIDANLVGQFVGSPVKFEPWSERQCDALLGDDSPTYLYIGSSCAELVDNIPTHRLWTSADYAQWMRDCATIRERVASELVEQIDVPAHKMSWHDFKERSVRLALYRLTDASICARSDHGRGGCTGTRPARRREGVIAPCRRNRKWPLQEIEWVNCNDSVR